MSARRLETWIKQPLTNFDEISLYTRDHASLVSGRVLL